MASSLSEKVFTGSALTDSEENELYYYVCSAVYGNEEFAELNKYLRAMDNDVSNRSKRKYFRSRFFISGEKLKQNYPFVYKHRVLYPALIVYRPIKGAITRPKALLGEYKKVRRLKKD